MHSNPFRESFESNKKHIETLDRGHSPFLVSFIIFKINVVSSRFHFKLKSEAEIASRHDNGPHTPGEVYCREPFRINFQVYDVEFPLRSFSPPSSYLSVMNNLLARIQNTAHVMRNNLSMFTFYSRFRGSSNISRIYVFGMRLYINKNETE